MHILYNISIILYRLAVILLSPFNRKAALWYRGRKGFFRRWGDFDASPRKIIWVHCASLGEFEQGRPVIEEIKRREPDTFILLSFFSPSGYEIRKNYPHAGAVCYLPADTPSNARRFIALFRPDLAVFVKYEFWYNYIAELNRNRIPLYLVSAGFRADQVFFRWYGRWFAGMLRMFTHIFVQSDSSRQLLKTAGVEQVTVAGDTRFDRVLAITTAAVSVPAAAVFSEGSFTMVAGSTWPPDHDLLVRLMNEERHDIKLIVAPHEIDEDEIEKLVGKFSGPVVRFSQFSGTHRSAGTPGADHAPAASDTASPRSDPSLAASSFASGGTDTASAASDPASPRSDPASARVLVIDSIGILSSLYAYGDLAYIGGGFGKGIHNILEACTHGIPVLFGPNYKKFREARELVEAGGAFAVENYDTFRKKTGELVTGKNMLKTSGKIAGKYVKSGAGATRIIVDKILIS